MAIFRFLLSKDALLLAFLLYVLFPAGAKADWISSVKSDGVAYFFYDYPARTDRYDLTDGQWLSSISLPSIRGVVTCAHADKDGIYVGYGRSIYRYSLDGLEEAHLLNVDSEVDEIFSNESFVYVVYGSKIVSFSKSDNGMASTSTIGYYRGKGFSILGSGKRAFFVGSSNIYFLTLNEDGTFGQSKASSHHGDYSVGTRTWVFPDDTKVLDDSGTVYRADDLKFSNSLGGKFDQIDFYGQDTAVVLRDNELIKYNEALLPSGKVTLSFSPKDIWVSGEQVFCFSPDAEQANGVRVDEIQISELTPPVSGEPLDPKGLAYTPDATFLDKDGILYLFDGSNRSLFRWDPVSQDYQATIPLIGEAKFAAYSSDNHSLYLAYESGLIRSIDLDADSLEERPFAILPQKPLGLAVAGQYIFAVDSSGAWNSHYTFEPDGTLIDSVDWNYVSKEFIWNSANQKMYYFSSHSPRDLVWEEINADGVTYADEVPGGIGAKKDSPYHSSSGFSHPIRVEPNGSVVVLGSGVIHDAKTLVRLTSSLGNSVSDIAWLDGDIHTTRTLGTNTQYQAWSNQRLSLSKVREVPGTAHRLLAYGNDQLLGISLSSDGVPVFYLLNENFEIVPPASLATPDLRPPVVSSSSSAKLTWSDVSGEESFVVERRIGENGIWVEIGTTKAGITNFTDDSLSIGTDYFYRVKAVNGTLVSAKSTIQKLFFGVPSTPLNVQATALSASAIKVTWGDVANETAYSLERRKGASGTWVKVVDLLSDTTSYLDKDLTFGTEYRYRVRATNVLGNSPYSEVSTARTQTPLPEIPSFHSYWTVGGTSVTITWSRSLYASTYTLQRKSSESDWESIGTTLPGKTSFVDNSVEPLTRYSYRLRANNSTGSSNYSEDKTITTKALPRPEIPYWFDARAESASEIRLTWQDLKNEDGYRLERKIDTQPWETVATLGSNVVIYTDSGLTEGVEYLYRLVAFNSSGDSDYSNIARARPVEMICLWEDDFDPDYDPSFWLDIQGGEAIGEEKPDSGFLTGNALWFGGNKARIASTRSFNVSEGSSIRFSFKTVSNSPDDSHFWDAIEYGEEIVLEYSTNNGAEWNTMGFLYPAGLIDKYGFIRAFAHPERNGWMSLAVAIPSGAMSTSTRFRWRQFAHTGSGFDSWALEDVCIITEVPEPPQQPPFILSSASSSVAIALYWAAVSEVDSYLIERRSLSSQWDTIATVSGSRNYYTDSGLKANTWYTYRVSAINAGGTSIPSNVTGSITYSQIAEWSMAHFGDPGIMTVEELMKVRDDGHSYLLKFAYNLDPSDSPQMVEKETGIRGVPQVWFNTDLDCLCAEFVRRKQSSNPGITYRLQFSNDLLEWADAETASSSSSIDDIWERVVYIDRNSQSKTKRFCRVVVSVGKN